MKTASIYFSMLFCLVSCHKQGGSSIGECDFTSLVNNANYNKLQSDLYDGTLDGDSSLARWYLGAALASIDSAIECSPRRKSGYWIKLQILGRMKDYLEQLKFLESSRSHFLASEFYQTKGLIFDSLKESDSSIYYYLKAHAAAVIEVREDPEDSRAQIRLVQMVGLLYGLDSAKQVLESIKSRHESTELEDLYRLLEFNDTLRDGIGILENRVPKK